MSGSLPQLQTFQLPDVSGVVTALQGLELNRMRSQQLQGAEQERNALRQYLSSPDVDIMSPETTRRVLAIAPTIGGPALQAATAARREAAQTQTAELERTIKYIEKYRNQLPGVTAETYPALRARILRDAPGWAQLFPEQYDPDRIRGLIERGDDFLKQYGVNVTALPGGQGYVAAPQVVPRGAAPLQGPTFYPAESIPAAPPPAAAGAPAPRAQAPGLTPAQLQAAHMLRGFERFEGTPYFDRTAFRAGFGSDTTTLADGTVVPVRQGMTVSREDAERDLARRVPEFTQRAERNIGAENFARLPPNAQAALISIAYNYGHIPESLLPAARSGDLTALSQAVAALPANPSRRQSEAAVIAGQGPRLVQANAMVPGAAPVNAMLAPQDATAVPRPLSPVEFPGAPRPASLSEADLLRRIRDVQQKEAEARMLEDIRRETAAARAAEEAAKARGIAQAQAEVRGALPPPPAGQRYNAEGRLEDIPGSERERAAAERRAAELAKASDVTRDIDRILDLLDTSVSPVTGFMAPTLSALLSGSPATNVKRLRDTIESNISLSTLQQLRAQSPTGAALGQVTNQDMDTLKASLSSLSQDQSPQQFRQNLLNIRNKYMEIIFGPRYKELAPPAREPPAPERLPGRRGAPPISTARPTLEQFLERARQEPRNANVSIEDLTAYYNRTYGGR